MTLKPVNDSQRTAARVAGFTFLFAITLIVIANYGISFRILIPGNAYESARNIIAEQTLFRTNVACNLLYVLNTLVLTATLYVVLEPLNRTIALVGALCRLMYASMWAITALNMLSALRLLADDGYLASFGTDQLYTLARLQISIDAYYIGLPFWGIASIICSYVLYKSSLIPRAIACLGIVSSAWCIFCSFAFLIYPNFELLIHASLFDMPLVVFEITAGFWLLIKGLSRAAHPKPSEITDAHISGSQ
jgi:hypothetical protein